MTAPSNSTDSSLVLVATTKQRSLSFQPSSRLQMKVNGSQSKNDMPSLLKRVRRALGFPLRVVGRWWRKNGAATDTDDSTTTAASTTAMEPPVALTADDDSTTSSSMTAIPGRSATATVDLSGEWELVVTDAFKQEYDQYLLRLGQPFLVRSVAVNIIALTQEETQQSQKGRTLFIRGRNVKGVWERTLTASGPVAGKDFEPIHTPITTADDEEVLAEAWWEDNGTVHRSWLRGVEKYGGGSFESKRYLQDGGKVLVCESIFHPNDAKRKKATVTWKFQRLPTSSN